MANIFFKLFDIIEKNPDKAARDKAYSEVISAMGAEKASFMLAAYNKRNSLK